MRFTKNGEVRIEQLRDEIRKQVIEFPTMAVQWTGEGIDIEDVDGNATRYQTQLQTVIDAHVPSTRYFDQEIKAYEVAIAINRKIELLMLPDWATWNPNEAQTNVTNMVLQGQTKEQVNTWIDTNVVGANVATLAGNVRTAMKLLAGAIIDLRTVVAMIAKVIMFIRDIIKP
jgi:hypothetical protein